MPVRGLAILFPIFKTLLHGRFGQEIGYNGCGFIPVSFEKNRSGKSNYMDDYQLRKQNEKSDGVDLVFTKVRDKFRRALPIKISKTLGKVGKAVEPHRIGHFTDIAGLLLHQFGGSF